jgi:hypothetical protein
MDAAVAVNERTRCCWLTSTRSSLTPKRLPWERRKMSSGQARDSRGYSGRGKEPCREDNLACHLAAPDPVFPHLRFEVHLRNAAECRWRCR